MCRHQGAALRVGRKRPGTCNNRDGMDSRSPDIWQLMFDQTPTIIRFMLGVLTLGIFTIAGVLYRWHREDLKEVHHRVDRLEQTLEERHHHVYQRMDEQNRLLVEIASNTKRG